jgi:hypothetical protein
MRRRGPIRASQLGVRPDDRNGHLPTEKRPLRVLVIAASNRRQFNCPGVDGKARSLMFRLADRLPATWEIDLEDLGNVWRREKIQSCNACVSTSMALCVWPCNCYEKGSREEPDLLWNLDLYARLDLADAWAFIAPVNWYAPTSNLKLLFDRLVCMNGGNPREDLIRHKDPELAMMLERSPGWAELSVNHLEGRSAAFLCYGDAGGEELDASGRPKALRHREWFEPGDEPFAEMRQSYAPLVWQCRYSGVEVPDPLWTYLECGRGKPYAENQAEHLRGDEAFLSAFDAWVARFVAHVQQKGKVEPGRHRAFGHRAPGHSWDDLRLKWRGLRIAAGHPPSGSSPAQQQRADLNRDATLAVKKGEGAKLRRR